MEQLTDPDRFVNLGVINSIVENYGKEHKRHTTHSNEYSTLYLTED